MLINIYFDLPKFYIPYGAILGVILIVISVLVVIYCSFKHYKTGRATVVPIQNAKELIVNDIYQYTRNPIYLAAIVTFLGLFLYTGYLTLFIYFLLSIPALHWYVVFVEEPECRKSLGGKYIQYCNKVPRWLPRLH